uniref:Uncharacterized protein n=1 Tax=Triticum urartu TaxID=4572 RepID=A0A8R7PRV8_TRIUA
PVDTLAVRNKAGGSVAERERSAALVGLGGGGSRGDERDAGDGLPHHAAARVAAGGGDACQRDRSAERGIPAQAESGADGVIVGVGELGERAEGEGRRGVAVAESGGRNGAREGVVEARVVLLGGLGLLRRRRRHGGG